MHTQETTPHLYQSPDNLVVVRILDAPRRWPESNYRCLVLRVKPKDHERIRQLDDGMIEIMLSKTELFWVMTGFERCDPDFKVTFHRPMVDKPVERKLHWRAINQKRISQQRLYRNYRSNRRS